MTETPEHLDKEELRSEARDIPAVCKRFCQQRARGKTKENAGTLPVALT